MFTAQIIKKASIFNLDADGLVFNAALNDFVSTLSGSEEEVQKRILDNKYFIQYCQHLFSWIDDIIKTENPEKMYFMSFSNRQDIETELRNRLGRSRSLFTPVLSQLVDHIKKKYGDKVVLLTNWLADLYVDEKTEITLSDAVKKELKLLQLQDWNLKSKNLYRDEDKVNLLLHNMLVADKKIKLDFPGDEIEISHHVIDDLGCIINPLYQLCKANPQLIQGANTSMNFYQFDEYCRQPSKEISFIGCVKGIGIYPIHSTENIITLSKTYGRQNEKVHFIPQLKDSATDYTSKKLEIFFMPVAPPTKNSELNEFGKRGRNENSDEHTAKKPKSDLQQNSHFKTPTVVVQKEQVVAAQLKM